jgi:GNAT superfamily N-acetyltransferase
MPALNLQVFPLTPERWTDFEAVLGAHGAYGGCWCMFWRMNRADFQRMCGDGTHQVMRALVDSGETPGLLGYLEGKAVGWVSVGPRADFPALDRSPTLKPVDDAEVWSVNCFYVVSRMRHKGVSHALLRAAVTFAVEHGARIVEGYPVDVKTTKYPAPYLYTGALGLFLQAGFVEVLRRRPTRPILRYMPGGE